MNQTIGLTANSNWSEFVRPVPIDQILSYVHKKWGEFVTKYSNTGEHFQKRDEPALTRGLAAFLLAELQIGKQPFPGDFLAELQHFDLQPDGSAICVARTDIEWRLFGFPCFILEFKILDGSSVKRSRYLSEGVSRFVIGKYGPTAEAGAIFAFLRSQAQSDPENVENLLAQNAADLNCLPPNGPHIQSPSKLSPQIARFDTVHFRPSPCVWPLALAHVFVALPA